MAEFELPNMQWLLSEARNRWLHADEICQMLLNHLCLQISEKPPTLPCSGSVFFYDRRVTRYFRNDGLNWKKRKDGKTINEAHEKLKVGNIEKLHCYYARGEENPNFQRRIYTMLDLQLMHIVFVHYLDVKITCRSSTLASPVFPLEPSSCLGFQFDSSKGLFEQRTQDSNAEDNLGSCCSFCDCQNDQPAQSIVQMRLATMPFNCESMHRNISCPLSISESSLDKAAAQNLVIASLQCWEEGAVFPENDETPLLVGPSHVSSILDALNFPVAENSDSSYLFASNEMDTLDSSNLFASNEMDILAYAQTSASLPDLCSSSYPTMVPHGLDDDDFQKTETMDLRNNSSSIFLGEVSGSHFHDTSTTALAFCEEDHFSFPYGGFQSEELDNLQAIINEFLLELATEKANRRWTKVCGVLRWWFSARKVVAFKRATTKSLDAV